MRATIDRNFQRGHNVLEPASQGLCVITGPHTQNFAAITRRAKPPTSFRYGSPISVATMPVKMMLRWTLNLHYLVTVPEIFFNI